MSNFLIITNFKFLLLFILLVGIVFVVLYYILTNENGKIGSYVSKYDVIKNKYTFIAAFFILIGIATGISDVSEKSSVNSFLGSLGASFVILGVASFGIDFVLHKEFMSVIRDVGENVDTAISTSILNYSHGLVAHPNHHNIMPRETAITKFLRPGEIFRLISTNGDKYFQKGCEARYELEKKIIEEDCKIKGLLYFPVFDADREFIGIGPKLLTPKRIMNEHKTLREGCKPILSHFKFYRSIAQF